MKRFNPTFIISDLSQNATSDPMPVDQIFCLSMQTIAVGASAAGTVKIQFSNNPAFAKNGVAPTPTHWSDLTSYSITLSGATVLAKEKIELSYQWIRVVFTTTGGAAGSCTVNLSGLGA